MLVIESRKSDSNTTISEIENEITANDDHDKYITTQELDSLPAENVTARLKQLILASRTDIANFVKKN